MQYINCGHNPPLIQVNGEEFVEMKLGTTVLGMFNPLPFMEVGKLENVKEFLLFCYTDGLNEAINLEEEEFGEENIYKILDESKRSRPQAINKKMMGAVDAFRQGQEYRDDVTLFSAQLKA
jgi:sigma-B regulation protein RsbU (phosphoserine phosphatase)